MMNELRRMNEVERQSLSTLIDSTQWHYAISTEMRDEPPRDYRRLHFVRTWSHGEIPNTSI